MQIVTRMGERLTGLYIICECPARGLSDDVCDTIARNCPNLESFEYECAYRGLADGQLTDRNTVKSSRSFAFLRIFQWCFVLINI